MSIRLTEEPEGSNGCSNAALKELVKLVFVALLLRVLEKFYTYQT